MESSKNQMSQSNQSNIDYIDSDNLIVNLKDSKLATVTEHALGKVLSFENSNWEYI